MASTINATSTSNGGLISTGDDSGVLNIQTNETTAISISTSQNLGVGGITPSPWTIFKAIEVGGNGAGIAGGTGQPVIFCNATYNSGWKYTATGVATNYDQTAGAHRWFNAVSGTAGNAITFTQAMTLDASGNLLVGTSTDASSTTAGVKIKSPLVAYSAWSCGSTTSEIYQIGFINGNGLVGRISTNGSSTSYVTSSDYRLKNTIEPMTGALAKVVALKPCTYKWNSDDSDGEGFIAHELAEVCPQAVSGDKDAMEEDGVTPKYQGIDTSFLVATLTAAIQEQQALITTLTERITALEAK